MHNRRTQNSLSASMFTLALAAVGGSKVAAQAAPAPGYSLIWNDEFNGTELDRGLWCTRYAHGGGAALEYDDAQCTGPDGKLGTGDFLKDERQRYRDHNSRGEALHVVHDGHLSLHATKTASDDYASYEAALVRSKLELRPSADESYYITSRVRLPDVQGSFAALWLTSGYGDDGHFDWPPEIDILEAALNAVEDTDNKVRIGVAVKGAQTESGKEEYGEMGPHFSNKWNNFTADKSLRDVWLDIAHEWTAGGVCTYINGELVLCENYRWLTNDGKVAHKANVILNLAVGGEWAGRHGIDDSKPMAMDVDYLRVFKKTGAGADAPKAGTPVTSSEPPVSTGNTGSASAPADGSEPSSEDPWYESWYFWR
jgi:beta-glucanase (GH16 family)